MSPRNTNEVLALAALYQAIAQVRGVAEKGQWDGDAARTCLDGLLQPYDGDVAAAYGGVERLESGLRLLHMQLVAPQDMDQTRYVIMAVHLERKLIKQPAMLKILGDGLVQSRRQQEYFGGINENVIGGLADLYAQTVSELKPRIMVQGHRQWLDDPRNANRIRALLLSAIRAATLWRSAGGSRIRLIFGRNRLTRLTKQLLDAHAPQAD